MGQYPRTVPGWENAQGRSGEASAGSGWSSRRAALAALLPLDGTIEVVAQAENGRDALDQCRMSMPDVVLLDWNMPVMDGIAFLVALRKEQGGDAPKVIFCTTENDVEHITRAISAGANEYIMKPFDRDIIEAKFHEVGLI